MGRFPGMQWRAFDWFVREDVRTYTREGSGAQNWRLVYRLEAVRSDEEVGDGMEAQDAGVPAMHSGCTREQGRHSPTRQALR